MSTLDVTYVVKHTRLSPSLLQDRAEDQWFDINIDRLYRQIGCYCVEVKQFIEVLPELLVFQQSYFS